MSCFSNAVPAPRRLSAYLFAVALACAVCANPGAAELPPEVEEFINHMERTHDVDRDWLAKGLSQAEKKEDVLEIIARPPERTKLWWEYRNIFLTKKRIRGGRDFWRDNRATLERATREYGVPVSVIVSIIGVETFYGRIMGKHRVLDALYTLGFYYPPRSRFFRSELEHFFLLVREQQRDPTTITGSYAGAMGYGQFIPSSYRSYAVDFDNDGVRDLWENPVDAIGSVAAYLKRHGWKPQKGLVVRARLGEDYDAELANPSPLKLTHSLRALSALGFTPSVPTELDQQAMLVMLEGEKGTEYWLGLKNFYVITRYNHSRLYAMVVHQLSEAIAALQP